MGFDILIPNNLLNTKNIIYLKGKEMYEIEVGRMENEFLNKINNFLNNLSEFIRNKTQELENLIQRERDIKVELAKDNDYVIQINQISEKLKQLDKDLGLNNYE